MPSILHLIFKVLRATLHSQIALQQVGVGERSGCTHPGAMQTLDRQGKNPKEDIARGYLIERV